MFKKNIKILLSVLAIATTSLWAAIADLNPHERLIADIRTICSNNYVVGAIGRHMSEEWFNNFIRECEAFFLANRGYVALSIQKDAEGQSVIRLCIFNTLCRREITKVYTEMFSDQAIHGHAEQWGDYFAAHRRCLDKFVRKEDGFFREGNGDSPAIIYPN